MMISVCLANKRITGILTLLCTLLLYVGVVYSYDGKVEQVNMGWRRNYANSFMVELLKLESRRMLDHFIPVHEGLKPVMMMVREKKTKEALLYLHKWRSAAKDKSMKGEAIFLSGLIDENIGFMPESMGNYSLIISLYRGNAFYRMALIRKAFRNLIKIAESNEYSHLDRLTRDFYAAYDIADTPAEWNSAISGLAAVMFLSKKNKEAEVLFRRINSYSEKSPFSQYIRGENLIKLGHGSRAKVIFRRLYNKMRRKGGAGYILLKLGDMEEESGAENRARNLYTQLLKSGTHRYEDRVMGTMALAELYLREKRYKDISVLLEPFIDKVEDERIRDTALYYLSEAYLMNSEFGKAVGMSRRLLASDFAVRWKKKGVSILETALEESARESFTKGDYISVAESYYMNRSYIRRSGLLGTIADSLLRMGLYREARRLYGELSHGDDRKYRLNIARSYIKEGDAEGAQLIVDKVVERKNGVNKELSRLILQLGELYMERGDYIKAFELYSRTRAGMSSEVEFQLARTLSRMDMCDDADDLYSKSEEAGLTSSGDTNWVVERGDCYYHNRRWLDASKYYSSVIGDLRGEARDAVLYKMGNLNIHLGKKRTAIEFWKKLTVGGKGYLKILADEKIKEAEIWSYIMM